MDHIKQRLAEVERPRLLWLLAQLIHELTVVARSYYDRPGATGRLHEINEAIHRISGHTRDLVNADESFTASRADSIGKALKRLPPVALSRFCEFTVE